MKRNLTSTWEQWDESIESGLIQIPWWWCQINACQVMSYTLTTYIKLDTLMMIGSQLLDTIDWTAFCYLIGHATSMMLHFGLCGGLRIEILVLCLFYSYLVVLFSIYRFLLSHEGDAWHTVPMNDIKNALMNDQRQSNFSSLPRIIPNRHHLPKINLVTITGTHGLIKRLIIAHWFTRNTSSPLNVQHNHFKIETSFEIINRFRWDVLN